jgi:AraC family transcriptional regulator, regulatory protein of adaptative response / methylated-DNA-[protein]-cysteine methyltransferase
MNSTGGSYLRYANGIDGRLNVVGASYGPAGSGACIAYTIVSSEFGFILIAATTHGICWLGIHQCEAYLESELRGDFPKAKIARDDSAMRRMAERVIAFVGDTSASLDLPLDIRATPFQLAVWRELCMIPPGTTTSYGEIARRLGQPGSARAVGRANGSNPLALLIPCHRAIGADGKLTGYRWGLEYKRRLLEYERSSLSSRSIHHQ